MTESDSINACSYLDRSPSKRVLPLALLALLLSLAAAGGPAVARPPTLSNPGFTPSNTQAPTGTDTGPLTLDSGEFLDLSGSWRFKTGDDPSWAQADLDDSDWDSILVPLPWGRQGYSGYLGMGWYRKEIDLRRAFGPSLPRPANRLAVAIGKVSRSYEIYAGGHFLGRVGKLPPEASIDYDRHKVYPIPPSAVDRQGRLVLALRVWAGPAKPALGGGPFDGDFLLGLEGPLVRHQLLVELPHLVLTILFIVTGLYHLYLYRRGYEEQVYVWFSLASLDIGFYGLLRTQWKYHLIDDFLLLKELEYLALYCFPAIMVQFFWPLLSEPISRWLRGFQIFCVALGVSVAVTPGLTWNQVSLDLFQLLAALVSLWGFWILLRGLKTHKREARTIAFGAAILVLCFLNDLAGDRGWFLTVRLIHFGFGAFVFSVAASLAHRFGRIHSEAQDLRSDLEVRVWERTAELARSNTQLQEEVEERARAERSLRKHLMAMEVSTDGIVILDEQYLYIYANAAYAKMHGYRRAEELIGLPWWVVHDEVEALKLSDEALPLLESEGYWQGEAVSLRATGASFPTEISAAAIEEEGVVCVYRDVTERHKVDRLKDEFVATVSHELRTPLTSIKGSLALVTEGVMGDLPESILELLQVARTNSDRLVRLINDLLDIQKIEAGKIEFNLHRLSLRDLMQQVITSFEPMAREENVELRLLECPEDIKIRADNDRFHQVLGNLLSNAVKFSPEGASVSLQAVRHNVGVRISVADEGPGIPEAFRPQVFERFSQAQGDNGATGGTGLGLSIARAIARQQGGEITFECGTEGGTVFMVDLPTVEAD